MALARVDELIGNTFDEHTRAIFMLTFADVVNNANIGWSGLGQ